MGRTMGTAGVAALLAMGLVVGSIGAASAAAKTVRYVDDDGKASVARGCAGGKVVPRSIQVAIDRSDAADEVRVCPGTYRELISIGAGHDGLMVRAVPAGSATIKLPPVSTARAARRSARPAGGSGISDLVVVTQSERVTVRGFKLVAPTDAGCGPVNAMVRVAGGALDTRLVGLRITAGGTDTLDGSCGYGTGILVGADAVVIVTNGLIRDFQDGGVVADQAGSSVTVRGTEIQYHHAAETAATCGGVGVRVADGVTGSVSNVAIVGLVGANAGSGTPLLCEGVVAGPAAGDVVIRDSRVRHAAVGVRLDGLVAPIVMNTTVLDARDRGIVVAGVAGGEIALSTVRGAAGTGIDVAADVSGMDIYDNTVTGNGNPDCADASTGGGSKGTANTWTGNTGEQAAPTGICKAP